MKQINCYQNVGTKLTVTPKYKDQNDIFDIIKRSCMGNDSFILSSYNYI